MKIQKLFYHQLHNTYLNHHVLYMTKMLSISVVFIYVYILIVTFIQRPTTLAAAVLTTIKASFCSTVFVNNLYDITRTSVWNCIHFYLLFK